MTDTPLTPPADVPLTPLAGTKTCPRITTGLPGLGGYISFDAAHFYVDEIPAYPPTGEGTHWFVRIRKQGMTTEQAKRALADAAGIQSREIGAAGRKDKYAITTQWMSMPCAPIAPDDERIEILEQTPHEKKLRTGHLRGNRFRLRLTDLHPEARERWPAIAERLQAGVPNYFGVQRFGRFGLQDGLAFLNNPRKRVRDPRFVAGIVQSAAFNLWLGERVKAEQLHTAIDRDVLKKRETGGMFDCEDAAIDAPRVASGEVDVTGPLPGPKCRGGGGTEYYNLGDPQRMKTLARFAPGTRRVARIVPGDVAIEWLDDNAAWITFSLPKGSYATVVIGEITQAKPGESRRNSTP